MSDVLQVRDLCVRFGGREALRGISFGIARGEEVALVGESGAGKSLTALALMGLLPRGAVMTGEVSLLGEPLTGRSERELARLRGRRIAMVFQDGLAALNPVLKVGAQVAEAAGRERVGELLEIVGIPAERASAYPHELSGGMRQRVMIAMAVAHEPALILADEPTASLDVTVQAQVLEVLRELRARTGAALLLITHDLKIAARSDRVLVLHEGRLARHGRLPDVPPMRQSYRARPKEAVLRVEGLTAGVIDHVDLRVGEGEIVGLIGESGAGKTSLLRQILRLERPARGRIEVCGRDTAGLSPGERKALRADVQVVFQDPWASLNPRMAVADIIAEPLRVHRRPLGGRVEELLELVELTSFEARRYPKALSGGQRQRVAIARALALEPRLLLLDEPVSALDVRVRAGILELIQELRQRLGVACLLVSHDLTLVRQLADRVAIMHRGRIVETGPPERIFASPVHPQTRVLVET